ncbi:MAG: hypothetical protein E3J70_01780, partial [Candidatus Heimdallarchaeota archaeon]
MNEKIIPPVARKELKITELFDQKFEDNYFWLRNKENQEVI